MTLTSRQKGIFYIMLSAFAFAFMNLFVRMSGDLPPVQKSFFRNFISMLSALFILMKERPQTKRNKTVFSYLMIRSVAGTLGVLCNFYSVDHLMLSDASMLNKMSPFFAILFGIFILKERINLFQLFSILVAFVGALLVIQPSGTNMNLFPALIGLAGGALAGISYTYVRALGKEGIQGPYIVFFFSTFSCLCTAPFLIFNFHAMTGMQWAYLLLAGLSASFGQFAITAAYCHAPAREISVYDYSQIPFAALLGFLFFQQVPNTLSWIGYLLIAATAIGMYFHQNREEAHAQETTK